jgi:phosphatidylglycerophosphatase A
MKRGVRWLAWAIATWFGCGLVPRAPGTVGTLGAVPLYLLVAPGGQATVGFAAIVLAGIGVWASGLVALEIRKKDPQAVVVDEVAGFFVTMIPAHHVGWRGIALGFFLFRGLDITKPWPIRRFEALPGGWGIVADDIAAGVVAAGFMALARVAGVIS